MIGTLCQILSGAPTGSKYWRIFISSAMGPISAFMVACAASSVGLGAAGCVAAGVSVDSGARPGVSVSAAGVTDATDVDVGAGTAVFIKGCVTKLQASMKNTRAAGRDF